MVSILSLIKFPPVSFFRPSGVDPRVSTTIKSPTTPSFFRVPLIHFFLVVLVVVGGFLVRSMWHGGLCCSGKPQSKNQRKQKKHSAFFYFLSMIHCTVYHFQGQALVFAYFYYYYYYYHSLQVPPTSVSWWYFPGVWLMASFLRSAGLLSVFRPILIMLLSG